MARSTNGRPSGHKAEKGYTLIELAIVMAVVGVLIGSFVSAYNIYAQNQARAETADHVNMVISAINGFLVQNGRYPCPASLTAPRDDVLYGLETRCNIDLGVAYGECSDAAGICRHESEREVNVNPSNDTAIMETPGVRRGAVPFRALGLPEHMSLDGQKMRLVYVVSENLAQRDKYRKESGAISIINNAVDSVVTPEASVHFAIISYGNDKIGAYTRGGTQFRPCAADFTVSSDAVNCLQDNPLAIYRQEQRSTEIGRDHYDDYVKFYSSTETPMWRVADEDGFDISDLVDAGGTGKIGVAMGVPSEALDIGGNIHVETDIMTQTICNQNGEDCFATASIGGDNPEFQCDNPLKTGYDAGKPYATAIGGNRVECTDVIEIRCPEGSVVIGLSADGVLQCQHIVSCDPESVNTCFDSESGIWETYSLPSGVPTQLVLTPVSGASRQYSYECTDGDWVLQTTSGVCTCNETDETIVSTCNSQLEGNWVGEAEQQHTITCPDGTETWSAFDTDECTCSETTENDVLSCDPGFTGQITKVRNWTCNSATEGEYDPWVVVSDTCTCSPDVEEQTFPCPTGYTGEGIRKQNTHICPDDTWTGWTVIIWDHCTCNSATIETRTLPCPEGEAGVIEQERTFNCTTSDWNPWVTINNYCGPVTYQWVPKVQQSGSGSVPLTYSAGAVCSTVSQLSACSTPSGSGYAYFDSCQCE